MSEYKPVRPKFTRAQDALDTRLLSATITEAHRIGHDYGYSYALGTHYTRRLQTRRTVRQGI